MNNKMLQKGNLSKIPFSFLLFQLWNSGSTGLLNLEKERKKRSLHFLDGEIILPGSGIQMESLYEYLKGQENIEPSRLKKAQEYVVKGSSSPVRALIERGVIKPDRLWASLREFLLDMYVPVFDWEEGPYGFDSIKVARTDILARVSTPEMIVHGVRKMENFKLIQSRLPEKNASFQFLPDSVEKDRLQPEELYIYEKINSQTDLKSLYGWSELGEKGTQKVLFLLMSLGYTTRAQISDQTQEKDPGKPLEMKKALSDLNEKSAYVFKYMSKEIGPVAHNVLEKSLDEIRGYLSPVFKDIRFDQDGRFDENKIFERVARSGDPQTQEDMYRDMSEILAAVVLAIKSTLGDEHEAQLFKNLNKL
jgi:hypothetical protein